MIPYRAVSMKAKPVRLNEVLADHCSVLVQKLKELNVRTGLVSNTDKRMRKHRCATVGQNV